MKNFLKLRSLLAPLHYVPGRGTKVGTEKTDVSKYSLKELKQDIVILNLLNGLNLTAKQIELIYSQALCYQNYLNETRKETEKHRLCIQKSLNRISLATLQGENPSSDWAESLQRAYQKRQEIKTALEDTRREHMWSVQRILTSAQKEALRSFKPCVLPSKDSQNSNKDFKNPVQVGQAMNLSGTVEFLEKYRQAGHIKRAEMEERSYRHLRKAIKRNTGIFDEPLYQKETHRLKKILGKALALSEVQFQLNKHKLAENFRFINPVKDLRKKIREIRWEKEKKFGREKLIPYTNIFICKNILPLLKEKTKAF